MSDCDKYSGYRHVKCVVDKILNNKWDARGL
jgi:hypothetical protein